jgi:hypothetical protein
LNALKLLLKCEMNLNHRNYFSQTAADLAWKSTRYEGLCELLNADSMFPTQFDLASILAVEDQETFANKILERNSFHNAIKSSSLEEVKEFIKENHLLKFAFDASNKSALKVALEAKSFEIYSFLRSEGFEHEFNESFSGIEKLSTAEKRQIANMNRKYFKSSDNSIVNYLLTRTRVGLSSKNVENYHKIVKKIYENLNETQQIKPILKAVASADELDILFDFNKDHVADLDPTKSLSTRSAVYFKTGLVLIGAACYDTRMREITGTLAHEFTHYAMSLIYGKL